MAACRMRGRTLTTKASRRRGIGPECQAKVEAAEIRNAPDGVYSGGDIVCRKDIFGTHVNVPYVVKYQSPYLDWGSEGNGSAALAMNILVMFLPYPQAYALHLDFKWKFVVPLPLEGGVIKLKAIRKFIKDEEL